MQLRWAKGNYFAPTMNKNGLEFRQGTLAAGMMSSPVSLERAIFTPKMQHVYGQKVARF